MLMAGMPNSIHEWVARLGAARLPVLASSAEALAKLKEHEDDVVARDISRVILRDPMLTLSVLVVLQTKRPNRRIVDITTIEHAVMIMGVSPFFRQFDKLPVVEHVLAGNPDALRGFMAVAARARHAASHARTWAALRCDIESDEVVIAALLHDMTELLIWFLAPQLAEEIAARMKADPTLRSAAVQRTVLGFPFSDLQSALCHEWGMPELLTSLMDEQHAYQPRARNALLAVALARHSSHGWRDAALPHDLAEIGELLGQSPDEVGKNIYRTELLAISELRHHGAGHDAIWLPPIPQVFGHYAAWMHDAEPGFAALALEQVMAHLSTSGHGGHFASAVPDHSNSEARDVANVDVIAFVMNGIHVGLGFERVLLLEICEPERRFEPAYVVGGANVEKLRDTRGAIVADWSADRMLLLRDAEKFDDLRLQLPEELLDAVGKRNSGLEFMVMPLRIGSSGQWGLVYADGWSARGTPHAMVPGLFRKMVALAEIQLNDF